MVKNICRYFKRGRYIPQTAIVILVFIVVVVSMCKSSTMETVIGGLFTVIGVIIGFYLQEIAKEKDYIRDVMPVISIPVKYNIADASYIQLLSKGDCSKEIFKTRIYLKNSEKAPFYIDSIVNSGNRYLPPMGTYFCEKGELICLMLPEKSRNSIYVLRIKSISGTQYNCKINIEDKSIKMEEK